MAVREHWSFACDLCGDEHGGYENEIAVRRAEIAHMESSECLAELDDRAHLELTIKRHHLATFEEARRA